MIEYPSIINSSKAPREYCIAFDKLDGSNIRVKWTHKKGFDLFGSRTQLIDESHPHLGLSINLFRKNFEEQLHEIFKKEWRNEREIVSFFEFYGKNSFAGLHFPPDDFQLTLLDVLVGHKNWFFVNPKDFIKIFQYVNIPRVIYDGKLNEEFIKDVRENKFGLNEGVVCKGIVKNGAYRGKMWMCKIKTQEYMDRLKARFEQNWMKYWE